MRNKTSKLRKLEADRYSILTEDFSGCYLCGKSPVDIHEIYGGCNRVASMKNGFCLPLCRHHHIIVTTNLIADLELKRICQREYEQTHSHNEFMAIIGKNYLE